MKRKKQTTKQKVYLLVSFGRQDNQPGAYVEDVYSSYTAAVRAGLKRQARMREIDDQCVVTYHILEKSVHGTEAYSVIDVDTSKRTSVVFTYKQEGNN